MQQSGVQSGEEDFHLAHEIIVVVYLTGRERGRPSGGQQGTGVKATQVQRIREEVVKLVRRRRFERCHRGSGAKTTGCDNRLFEHNS